MDTVQIQLAGTWVALMLVYLLGDVLRIFSGDFEKMMAEQKWTGAMWFGVAVLMVIPIVMILVTLLLDYSVVRWTNIIAAGFFFLFNLVGLPTYPSLYDKFLLVVSMVFNGVTIWLAWNWAAGV
jgi:hypothetical protein